MKGNEAMARANNLRKLIIENPDGPIRFQPEDYSENGWLACDSCPGDDENFGQKSFCEATDKYAAGELGGGSSRAKVVSCGRFALQEHIDYAS